MNEINLDIKNFYEKFYKKPVETNTMSYYYIDIETDAGKSIIYVAFKKGVLKHLTKEDLSKFEDEDLIYLFEGYRTEAEMLKMIKMKAFL